MFDERFQMLSQENRQALRNSLEVKLAFACHQNKLPPKPDNIHLIQTDQILKIWRCSKKSQISR